MSANSEYPKPSPTPTVKIHEPQQLQTQGGRYIAQEMLGFSSITKVKYRNAHLLHINIGKLHNM